MRLLVTGALGQLGSEVVDAARARGMEASGVDRADWDLCDASAIAAALDANAFDAVVNCAAWTDVDGAESHRDEAYRINSAAPGTLALECARRGLFLLHLSTDYVFDGVSPRAVDEDAAPAPCSVYGASKLAGEEAVRTAGGRCAIVRTSGLYGRDGPNFVIKVLRRAAAGEELRVVDDQVTSPTWTGHLATALLRLLELRAVGTYHLTNSGSTTWYAFAYAAVELAGLNVTIEPISSADLASPARRPQYSVLANGAWQRLGEPLLPTWQSALASYLAELRARGVSWLPATQRGAVGQA